MVGLFADLRLFTQALSLAEKQGAITRFDLEEEFSSRVQGLLYIERQSPRRWADLVRELRHFGWLQLENRLAKPQDDSKHTITKEGITALQLSRNNSNGFLRLLALKMHERYTIPGWFVDRLWKINPEREGEIVVPAPSNDWKPLSTSRNWEDNEWTTELNTQTKRTHEIIQSVCPGAFPIEQTIWLASVKIAWDRLGNLKRRKVSNLPKTLEGTAKSKVATYSVRSRLANAMKEAAVGLLFAKKQPLSDELDFYFLKKEPLLPRIYQAWIPRLEALELIFYTDAHPNISGRLLFPTSVFKESADKKSLFELRGIQNPDGASLWLHQPNWANIKEDFLRVLWEEHQHTAARVGSLYVPLLDVRDEVCRRLRISAALFDTFIELALRESVLSGSIYSISVETDIREDQQSAYRLLRRPIWINGTPHSLLAITELQKK